VLQCGALWCSKVQFGAVCLSVVECGLSVAVWCSVLQCEGVLQCVAVCCRHYLDTCLLTLCAELTAKERFVSAKKQYFSAKEPSYYARKILCVKEAQKDRV